jgi:ketosteroid isomerase-like protein
MNITVAPPSTAILDVIDRWHDFMRGELPDALDDLLADDAVMYSPVVFTPQRGKAIVAMYLEAAKATFAAIGFDADDGPSFRYVKHVVSGDTAVLEFETEMGGKYVNGVDIICLDGSGKIVEFRVMVRPLQALNAVHALMGAALATRDHKPSAAS